jgi:hypothetical protein
MAFDLHVVCVESGGEIERGWRHVDEWTVSGAVIVQHAQQRHLLSSRPQLDNLVRAKRVQNLRRAPQQALRPGDRIPRQVAVASSAEPSGS